MGPLACVSAAGKDITSRNVLLEQDGTEARVESTDTLVLQDLAEATNETIGEGRVRDETNTGGLEGTEGDVGEELSKGRRGEVDSSAVVAGSLVADQVYGLLLEELVTSELEGTLEEVTSSGGTETSPDSAGSLIGDDFPEAANETGVVGDGVELNSCLDAGSKVLAWHSGVMEPRAINSCRNRKNCATQPLAAVGAVKGRQTYTSTGVRAPWVTEQQTAPANANREYRARPVGAVGSTWAAMLAFAASTLAEPVAVGGGDVDMSLAV